METVIRKVRSLFSARRTIVPVPVQTMDLYKMEKKESDKFRKHLKDMHALENWIFFEKAVQYKQLQDPEIIESVANSMLKHFDQKSVLCINVSDETKTKILEKIKAKDYGPDLFEKAEQEITGILIQTYGIFKSSSS